PQAVNITLGCPGPFRRHESFCADVGERGIEARHQPDVCELGNAVHKDDVGWFDVTVDESVRVDGAERVRDRPPQCDAFTRRATAAFVDSAAKRSGPVTRWINLSAG